MKDPSTAAPHHFSTGRPISSYPHRPNFPLLRRPEFQSPLPEAPRINKESDANLLAQEIVHADDAVDSITLTLSKGSGSGSGLVLLSLNLNLFGFNFAERSHLMAMKERIG
jgi:hypothetical protein